MGIIKQGNHPYPTYPHPLPPTQNNAPYTRAYPHLAKITHSHSK